MRGVHSVRMLVQRLLLDHDGCHCVCDVWVGLVLSMLSVSRCLFLSLSLSTSPRRITRASRRLADVTKPCCRVV